MEYSFVYETSNKKKIKVFFISLALLVSLFTVFIFSATFFREAVLESFLAKIIIAFFGREIIDFTPLGLFYLSLVSSLFFIALPFELFFYFGLQQGNPFFISFLLTTLGVIPSMAFNYYVGFKFSSLVMNFLSKRKVYKVRRVVNKYGGLSIFLFSLAPFLPGSILTFSLGIAKYDFFRLSFYFILGSSLKLIVIFGVFLVLH
jgi:hypothetical protein